jgi:signal transduction histidine kinase
MEDKNPKIEQLEHEVEFLSHKILDLNKKFIDSEQAKSRFLSLVKDELNNPMTALLGLIKHLEIVKDEKSEKIFNIFEKELLSLDFKIQNIVVAAHIEGGNIDISNSLVHPDEIIQDVINSLRHLIQEKNVHIKIDNLLDDKIAADPQMIYIIVKNLLSNACKFGEEGSEILISLSIEDSFFTIKVKNKGDAPDTEYKAEVFKRFADGPGGERGLGIGLSIVREICEQLEGSVDYMEEDGFVTFSARWVLEDTAVNSEAYGADEFLFESFDDAVEY